MGLCRGTSFLTNLIAFYNKVTCLVDKGKAVGVVYLNFSKAFVTVSHNVFIYEVTKYGLDE